LKEEIVKWFSDKFSGLTANTKHYGETDVSESIIKEQENKHPDQEKNQD